ncbi:torsin-1A-like [Dendronephthya gigantea]|uniref:torsin-1A-like n=1 Tax=Dendronephthya gigantea TaxID=151771 RepID=UPI00106BF22A|nr:torsin-1A-like [Dendronephthya gigantea]
MKKAIVIFMILCFFTTYTVASPLLAGGTLVVVAGLVGKLFFCHFKECCNDKWISQELPNLKAELSNKVFGQHIAIQVVHKAIEGHIKNKSPSKALVLSLHGSTGCGKNHVSNIIADSLYKLGRKSKYRHLIIATHDFPHKERLPEYKDKLINFISEKVKACPKTLFIFDEVDKVPEGLMDTLRPFLEHHEKVDGVDYRKSIFILLSNTGAEMINGFVINHWRKGNKREDLTFKDLEPVINNGAFNIKGGLWHSNLIKNFLIDFFVPFLPLERSHVKECIRADLLAKNVTVTETMINEVANLLQYSSPDKIFSSTGCKQVSTKVYYVI